MATSKKDKAQTGAQRASKSYHKKADAGLQLIKVWVDPTEAGAVRNYASKKPLTKAKMIAVASAALC